MTQMRSHKEHADASPAAIAPVAFVCAVESEAAVAVAKGCWSDSLLPIAESASSPVIRISGHIPPRPAPGEVFERV